MRQSPCKWLERDETGRPRCEHGWAYKMSRGRWGCPKSRAETLRRYDSSEKGHVSRLRYQTSEKGRETKKRYQTSEARLKYQDSEERREVWRKYERTHIRLRIMGVRVQYPVPPEKKKELLAQYEDFKAQQDPFDMGGK